MRHRIEQLIMLAEICREARHCGAVTEIRHRPTGDVVAECRIGGMDGKGGEYFEFHITRDCGLSMIFGWQGQVARVTGLRMEG